MFAPFPRPAQARTASTLKPNHHDIPANLGIAGASHPHNVVDAHRSLGANKKQKECQFLDKNGSRHHSYDVDKAPYPLSYDRVVFEVEALIQRFNLHVTRSVSTIPFTEGPPKKCLDLGCGSGTWILDAAKEWPECHFVGFDLVNVQIPLNLLEPSTACRIAWVHGNFLTTKLPFEDDGFDYVHMNSIAKGVPENKWGTLFEEVNRVLRPGGAVEIIEDDIIFPRLPRWFTSPLHVKARRATSIHFPDSFQRAKPPSRPPTPKDVPEHDHALLESLYLSVFEHRFINLRPTAVLPIYLTTYFRHTYLGPSINFHMPHVAPPQPLPKSLATSYIVDSVDNRMSTLSQAAPFLRPTSLSFSSTASSTTTASTADSSVPSIFTKGSWQGGRPKSRSFSSSVSDTHGNTSTPTPQNPVPRRSVPAPEVSHRELYDIDTSGATGYVAGRLESSLTGLSERGLAMHLYCTYQHVLASQEAMWEELKDRVRKKEDLVEYGWEDDEELQELQGRKKFERLVERYKTDMQARIALWCSLTELGWPFPPREPLSKAEVMEEERIQQDMLKARKNIVEEDLQAPCRSSRVLVGFKSTSET